MSLFPAPGESPCRARCVVLIPAGTNVTVVGWVPSKGKGNMCIPFGGNEYRVVILFKSFARDIPRRSDINGMKCVTSVDIVVVENRQGVSYRPDVDGPRGRVLLLARTFFNARFLMQFFLFILR